jgi:hypothetical protein
MCLGAPVQQGLSRAPATCWTYMGHMTCKGHASLSGQCAEVLESRHVYREPLRVVCVCVCVCVCVYVCKRTRAHTHACTHIHTHTHIHTNRHTRAHTLIHTHTHACMHVHVHTYISVPVPPQPPWARSPWPCRQKSRALPHWHPSDPGRCLCFLISSEGPDCPASCKARYALPCLGFRV